MPGDAPPDEHTGQDPVKVAVGVVARGVLAGAATEVLLAAALLGVWLGLYGERGRPLLLLFALGAGVVAGLAWGLAEAVASRVRRPSWAVLAGAAAGAPIALLAPVAGEYGVRLGATGTSAGALEATLKTIRSAGVESTHVVLGVLVCGLCLHVPLLIVRRRGPHLTLEALAMSLGLVAWAFAAVALRPETSGIGDDPWALNASIYALGLLPRALVLPLSLRGADRLLAAVGRGARGAEADERPTPRVRPRAPTPSERHRARWHDGRASERAAAGRDAQAAEEWARAHALWPTVERALALAGAHARALAVDPTIAALDDASSLAGGRPPGFDPGDATWEPLRGHARFEALSSASPAAARRALGPAARMALCAYAVTLTLTSVAPGVLWPEEPAEVTLGRLRALLGGGGAAWLEVGEALESGVSPSTDPGHWTTGRFAQLGVRVPEPAPELALDAYLRAAAGGEPEGMLRASDALACYPERRAEAADWCRRAAEAGHPRGMWRWGTMLRGGWFGLAPDDEAGRAWWRRAAKAGQAEAQVDLARWHARQGELVEADAWYARAVAAGHETAEEERLALTGDGASVVPAVVAGE